jgi:hypothetical protein
MASSAAVHTNGCETSDEIFLPQYDQCVLEKVPAITGQIVRCAIATPQFGC